MSQSHWDKQWAFIPSHSRSRWERHQHVVSMAPKATRDKATLPDYPFFFWEELSMDQCQSRGELLTNFRGHWSIRTSLKTRQRGHWSIRSLLEIHMGQWLPNLSESFGLHWHRSIECSSLFFFSCADRPHLRHFPFFFGRGGSFLLFFQCFAECLGLIHMFHILWIEHEKIGMSGFARDGSRCEALSALDSPFACRQYF